MEDETSTMNGTSKKPIARPRTWSRFPLPSERFSFETHFEILRQFVVRTKQGVESVGADAVEGGAVPKQAAALNVRFLTSVGLLKQDENSKTKYAPTPSAIRLVSTRSVSDDKARPILRSLVEGAWFGEFTKNLFNTRPVTSEDEFVKELAIYAEVSDMTKKEQSLKVIVGYLTYSGLIARSDNGNLAFGTAIATTSSAGAPLGAVSGSKEQRATTDVAVPEGLTDWHVIQTEDFYLKVRSDADVLLDLREHLNLLEKKIARLRTKRESNEKGNMGVNDEF